MMSIKSHEILPTVSTGMTEQLIRLSGLPKTGGSMTQLFASMSKNKNN